MNKSVSIVGCGWLGLPLAIKLLERGYDVKGSTSTPEKLKKLELLGIKTFLLNLPTSNIETGKDLLDSENIIFNIPPGLRKSSEETYLSKIDNFVEFLLNSNFQKLIHISTTSIYQDKNGICFEKDVDASSIHYLVEEKLSAFCKKNKKQFISARCAGLMGYDRFPCKYYNEKSVINNGDNGVNYVHRDDVVSILEKLLEHQTFEGPINICTPLHPSRQHVIEQCARQAGRPLPVFSPEKLVGKIISTALLKKIIGHEFKYPNPSDFFYDFTKVS